MAAELPQLSRFDGPLDLLLTLITRRELDITTVSLAAVAEEYLAEVARRAEMDLERLTGYLVIASRLLLIKSQALLPRRASEEQAGDEGDGADLVRQLAEYRLFKEVAQQLREFEREERRVFPRQVPYASTGCPPAGAGSPADLAAAFCRALALAPAVAPAEAVRPPRFPVAAKMRELLARAAALPTGTFSFSALAMGASCRHEVVAYFLALLELLRRGRIQVCQEGLFGEILVGKAAQPAQVDDQQAEGCPDGVDADVERAGGAAGDEGLVELVGRPV